MPTNEMEANTWDVKEKRHNKKVKKKTIHIHAFEWDRAKHNETIKSIKEKRNKMQCYRMKWKNQINFLIIFVPIPSN